MRALKPILPYNNHLKPLVTTQAHEGIETLKEDNNVVGIS